MTEFDPSLLVQRIVEFVQASPPTWQSAIVSNILILIVGAPIFKLGLSFSGVAAAFLLGILTWRAFGSAGFIILASYFVIGTGVTKMKMAQKENEGVAEKSKGRRGAGSVVGSSAAGCVCAALRINCIGGDALVHIWELGFIASFCTKLCDTVSSEIGKAFGRNTYLITTFEIVPRGAEGAVSIEGTIAGLVASVILASVGCLFGQIDASEAVACVIAAQLANFVESIIGAAFQEKEGFLWLNNHAVNVINISTGTILAIAMQRAVAGPYSNSHT